MKTKFIDLCKQSAKEVIDELNNFFEDLHEIYDKK